MSPRLFFIVEGQTEETFVNLVLSPHLANRSIYCRASCVTTCQKGGIKYRGGLSDYQKPRRDIVNWMLQDRNSDAFFTTMFDFYRLPSDFPNFDEASKLPDPYHRISLLEVGFQEDIGDHRFIP